MGQNFATIRSTPLFMKIWGCSFSLALVGNPTTVGGAPQSPYCGWLQNPFRTALKPRLLEFTGGIIIPGFLRWCRISSIHSFYNLGLIHPGSTLKSLQKPKFGGVILNVLWVGDLHLGNWPPRNHHGDPTPWGSNLGQYRHPLVSQGSSSKVARPFF